MYPVTAQDEILRRIKAPDGEEADLRREAGHTCWRVLPGLRRKRRPWPCCGVSSNTCSRSWAASSPGPRRSLFQ